MQDLASHDATSSDEWLRFPVDWIVRNARVEGYFAKGVWLIVPLQYYVLTRFAGGFGFDAYVAAAMIALIVVICLLTLSCGLGVLWPRTIAEYQVRVRIWAVTLIVSWAVTLALLTLSYVSALHLIGEPFKSDIIGQWLYWLMRPSSSYPAFTLQTVTTYLAYAALAVSLIVLGSHLLRVVRSDPRTHQFAGPNAIIVVIIISIVMTGLHGMTTLPHNPPDFTFPAEGR